MANILDLHFGHDSYAPVLNTSLNCNGEPIVETEEDAKRLFDNTPVDIMVINNKVIERD